MGSPSGPLGSVNDYQLNFGLGNAVWTPNSNSQKDSFVSQTQHAALLLSQNAHASNDSYEAFSQPGRMNLGQSDQSLRTLSHLNTDDGSGSLRQHSVQNIAQDPANASSAQDRSTFSPQ